MRAYGPTVELELGVPGTVALERLIGIFSRLHVEKGTELIGGPSFCSQSRMHCCWSSFSGDQ